MISYAIFKLKKDSSYIFIITQKMYLLLKFSFLDQKGDRRRPVMPDHPVSPRPFTFGRGEIVSLRTTIRFLLPLFVQSISRPVPGRFSGLSFGFSSKYYNDKNIRIML